MATLIQSKQIQGIVTASIVDGDFTVSGSLIVSGSGVFTNDISASGIIRANQFIGDGSGITGIVASGTGIAFETGSVKSTITKIEISGSGIDVNIVNSNTASIEIKSPYEVGGLFRIYENYESLVSSSVNYFTDGQIVYVKDNNTLYQSEITYADFSSSFTDSIVWNTYTFAIGDSSVDAGNGISKTVLSGVTTLSLNTGSNHFTSGVEYIISSGSFTIDAGTI
jgi:hypothetical protein